MSAKAGVLANNKGVVKVGLIENVKTDKNVMVQTYRQGNFTIAEAMVAFKTGKNGDNIVYRAMGAAVKNVNDRENQTIGERLAIARSLRKLASMIVSETMGEVHTHSAQNGNPFSHVPDIELALAKDEIAKEEKRRKKLQAEKAKKRAEYLGEK